ncbi:MAG: hypothetical protein WC786_03680 [Patescibacteria group bacterium]
MLVVHDSLSEYRVVGCSDKNPGMRIEIAMLPMDKMEHPSEEWDVLICDSCNQHWALKKVSDDDFVPATCNIVLPTAGRPVFVKFPDIPRMSTKELSGTVHWAALEDGNRYLFAIHLHRYLDYLTTLPIMLQDLVHVCWDKKTCKWFVEEYGGKGKNRHHYVEVTFG